MTAPTISYDRDAAALYIRFTDREVASTVELSPDVYADVDEDGDPVGFEILHADPSLSSSLPNLPETAFLRDVMRSSAS